jgi:hypothetical protein
MPSPIRSHPKLPHTCFMTQHIGALSGPCNLCFLSLSHLVCSSISLARSIVAFLSQFISHAVLRITTHSMPLSFGLRTRTSLSVGLKDGNDNKKQKKSSSSENSDSGSSA